MIRKMVSICMLCFLLIGCISEQSARLESKPVSLTKKEEPTEEFVPMSIKLVGIGDSLTIGEGDESNKGGYVGIVKERLEKQAQIKEVLVENYGVRGYKTNNLQQKLKEKEVIASIRDADIILMTIGGNDIMDVVRSNIFSLDFEPFRKEQINYENKFKAIFATIRELNSSAYILYVGLYNPFKYLLPELTEIDKIIDEWNLASQQIMKNDEKAIYVSVDQIFSTDTNKKLLYKDEFHPNEIGYSLIADKVYEAIEENDLYSDLRERKERVYHE